MDDGGESGRPLVDPKNRGVNRPAGFRWDEWATSGGGRFQGGTLKGVTSKLDYLKGLGRNHALGWSDVQAAQSRHPPSMESVRDDCGLSGVPANERPECFNSGSLELNAPHISYHAKWK